MIRTSEQTDELMVALAKAQAKFTAAIKSNVNPMFKSKYADISSIIDATLEHLNAEGIVLMQHPGLEYRARASKMVQNGEVEEETMDPLVTMTTRIQFKGQWIESDMSAPAIMRDRYDAQSIGSACTYLSRYQMQNILVVPREDDDGQRAVGAGTREEAQTVGKKKVEDLTGKLKQSIEEAKAKKANGGYVTSLFYQWNDSSQTAEISGDEGLKTANKDLLKPLWSTVAKAIIANADQLDALKFQLEQRSVPFTQLGGKG